MDTGRTGSKRETLVGAARVGPVALAAAATAWGAAWHARGSIAAVDWLPVALLLAALVLVALLSGAALRPSRAALLSLAGIAGLAGWAALSLRWSPLPSLARDEALLTLAYALAFVLPVLLLRGNGERLAAVGSVGAAAGGLALALALVLATRDGVGAYFAIGRLEFPIAYANAQATVLVVGLWPALAVAASRAAPVLVRALATGVAAALVAGWLATQSKGGGIAIAVSTVIVLALSPARLRLAVPSLLAGACAAVQARTLTEPYRADEAAVEAAAAGVGRGILAAAAAAAALGLVYALVDRRLALGRWSLRVARVTAAVALVLALVVGATAFHRTLGPPDQALADGWRSFSTYHTGRGDQTHLVSLGGSNRYDFWRVSLRGAAEHPVAGIGARGFQAEYLREGTSPETPARAHSLPLELLLELGVVGLLLALLALVPALAAAVAAARRRALWAAAALGATSGWLAHAAVDWTWTFAAAGVPFFLLLGIGAAPAAPRALSGRTAVSAAAATALVAVLLFTPTWLSARLVERALTRPGSAPADLDRARTLDPIAVRPLLAAAQLSATPAAALEPLAEAAGREPRSVAVRYLYGVTLLEAGSPEQALLELEVARALAPRDALVAAALRRARAALDGADG